ncbi:Anti-sigma-28 factor, FlgM family protein [Alkaliphilus metalliredigens QYMF]|uniref:Negative regulator of flagellin synthesis n=1 Tax=Alkaliphilus metalliredigens (strain QYMF) TaxID=293826 RepID=A6TL82_ALKMQ|nr:flagellar biosynthesis anti-sigma factor FlgM [Alkaliphilus metalliredigens]ABR46950.1 Anti-sigma-28 factor, FlgM family protein [Alkaliphilus metalliredigens QYMF]
MKIHSNPNVIQAMKVYNKTATEKIQKGQSVHQPKDEIEISTKGKEFQVALKAFNALPEIREEKVKLVKEQMEQGSYSVSGKEVADKMIDGLMIDHKI